MDTTRTTPLHEVLGGCASGRRLVIVWYRGGVEENRGVISVLSDGLVLGRGSEADCQLESDQVSRKHARIELVHGTPVLRDLGSKNGTFINGVRATSGALAPQDVVRIGSWVGVVSWVGEATLTFELAFANSKDGLLLGPRTAEVFAEIQRVASSELRVMLVGETGTGKEVFARELHRLSGLPGALVAMNCAAIPEQLAEAELFGYRRGAFTGADRSHPGHFRAAHNGTLFLDEIGDLPPSIQAKLLRVLEERRVVPLGQSSSEMANARVVCASQSPLHEAVEEGVFRSDLYARLSGIEVRIVPLRQRREEVIPLLRNAFTQGGQARAIQPEAMEQLMLYDWPMNVRELLQLGARLRTMHVGDCPVRIDDLNERIATFARGKSDAPQVLDGLLERDSCDASDPGPPSWTVGAEPREELAQIFLAVLRETQGNVSAASERLGISRQRAYRLLRRLPDVGADGIRLGATLEKARSISPPGTDELAEMRGGSLPGVT